MPKTRKRSPTPRRLEIRQRWQQRLNAQRSSGIPQTQWCRENGIEPKYFSLWKGKLAKWGRIGSIRRARRHRPSQHGSLHRLQACEYRLACDLLAAV
jgi:hypothetical protein